MAFWRISQTQLMTHVYIVEADTQEAAEEVIDNNTPEPVKTYYGGGDMDEEIEGPFDSEEAAS